MILAWASPFKHVCIIPIKMLQNVASELKDPIWHSLEWQIGSFSSEATKM